jgi:DNA helicase HerA-like ATPase
MLGLSEAQEGVLNITFKIAEDEGLELDKLEDLKSALNYVGENRSKYTLEYGNITTQSVGVILRSLSVLENQGIDNFFGEPELDIKDFMSVDSNGKGIINILDAVELYKNPDLYAAVMLCLLTKLYDSMPEVGDLDKPKIVFFFDESYFLFREMPSYRLKQVEKIVRLIRSKGIVLYFISHYTTDIPATVLDQLGNRVQHNLKAYTPADQKNVKAAADAFRTNPKFNTYDTILELGTGEALVSFQNEKGEPSVVERVYILPPQSKIGVIDSSTRNRIINNSPICGKYDIDENDESAHEKITKIQEDKKAEEAAVLAEKEAAKKAKEDERIAKQKQREEEKKKREEERERKKKMKYVEKTKNRIFSFSLTKILNGVFNKFFKK